jgi:SNF2 family DNA or RNA helicase
MKYKTKPYDHQKKAFRISARREAFALFMEQGTGKTKVTIDTAYWLHSQGLITGMLVIAPNGVQENWVRKELPIHLLSEFVPCIYKGSASKKHKKEREALYEQTEALKVLAINIEAIRTEKGYTVCEEFLREHKTLLVIDESTIIKNHKAQQTKSAFRLASMASYRRILSGTPFAQSPLDGWAQGRFLDPAVLPYKSYTVFKAMFAEEEAIVLGNRRFNKVVGYKNQDLFAEHWKDHSFRVTKKECLDLPDKIYTQVYVEMSKEQKKAYQDLKEHAMTLIADGLLTTPNAITLMGKLHQIVCGNVKDDDGNVFRLPCPRLSKLEEMLDETDDKVIIWAHYREDIKRIQEMVGDEGVSYYGEVTHADRAVAIKRFNEDPETRYFIANKSASRGLTLISSATTIYYSNTYELETRLQSEDRNHRIGQSRHVTYTDIICPNTVDERIIEALHRKNDISNNILTQLKNFL